VVARRVVVATGKATLAAPGTVRLKPKLTKAGKKALKRKRALKVTVTTTFRPAGGGASATTRDTVTLKRKR
jgi:hypothetical protein